MAQRRLLGDGRSRTLARDGTHRVYIRFCKRVEFEGYLKVVKVRLRTVWGLDCDLLNHRLFERRFVPCVNEKKQVQVAEPGITHPAAGTRSAGPPIVHAYAGKRRESGSVGLHYPRLPDCMR